MRHEEILIESVGARIKQIRYAAGLRQEELAGRLGVCLRAYQRLESGQSNMNLRTIARVAEALGVEPGALFAQVMDIEQT